VSFVRFAPLHTHMHNAVDSGIESFQDSLKKSNKGFVPSWNVKDVDPS
jgi:hypothetical protein